MNAFTIDCSWRDANLPITDAIEDYLANNRYSIVCTQKTYDLYFQEYHSDRRIKIANDYASLWQIAEINDCIIVDQSVALKQIREHCDEVALLDIQLIQGDKLEKPKHMLFSRNGWRETTSCEHYKNGYRYHFIRYIKRHARYVK